MNSLIEEAIEFYWGKRCDYYEEDCACCAAWKEYDTMTTGLVKRLDNIKQNILIKIKLKCAFTIIFCLLCNILYLKIPI